MNTSEYIEVARFRTRAGVSDAEFLAAEQAVRAGLLKDFPGVIARELHHTTQGEWMVLLRFKDQSSMDLFLKRLKDDPDTSFKTYGSLIEHSTMRIDFAWRRH